MSVIVTGRNDRGYVLGFAGNFSSEEVEVIINEDKVKVTFSLSSLGNLLKYYKEGEITLQAMEELHSRLHCAIAALKEKITEQEGVSND